MKLIGLILFLFFSGILSSQKTPKEINLGWDQVRQFEESNDYVGIMKTLSDMQKQYETAKAPLNVRNKEVWKIIDYQMPLDTLCELLDSTDFLLAKAYEFSAIRQFYGSDMKLGEEQMYKSYTISKKYNKSYRAARYLGSFNYALGNYAKSIQYFNETIDAAQEYFPENEASRFRGIHSAYLGLVTTHAARGDIKSGKKYLGKAMVLAKTYGDDQLIARTFAQQLVLESNQTNFENVLKLIEENPDQVNILNNDSNYNQLLYDVKGRALASLKKYDEAIIALEKGLSFGAKESRLPLGICLREIGNFDKSIQYFNISIEEYEKADDISGLADSYFLRAKTYQKMGNIEQAKSDLLKAISFEDVYKDWRMRYFPALASVYLDYEEKFDEESYIDSVNIALAKSDDFISQLKMERRYFEDQISLGTQFLDVYSSNIEILSRLYKKDPSLVDNESLFGYFENLKANSLRDQLKTDNAIMIGNMPKSVLLDEKDFQNRLTNLQQQIHYLDTKDETDDQLLSLRQQVVSTKAEYDSFLQKLEIEYPGYYKHEYQNKLVSLSELQTYLTTEHLLEYFVSADHIFSILISADSFQLFRTEKPEQWTEKVATFQKLLHDPESSAQDIAELSSFFFKLLVQEQIQSIPKQCNKLRIVPDDLINFIPFEILLTEKAETYDFRHFPYLLHRFNISYSQSANLLKTLLIKERRNSNLSYAGFAPNYENELSDSLSMLIAMNTRGNHLDLPFARKSVSRVSELMGGKPFLNTTATKQSFFKNAPKARIIHLAMHGFIDLENPSFSSLLFYGKQPEASLFSSEVFGIELESDLAVLSACNTGIGKLVNGDGIQNMSRAFNFAGVKNTIMSLWSVPDVQTSQIIYKFFQNIKEELPIDVALTKSKQSYLENSSRLSSHPYYWAGMVANGTMEPIQFNSMNLNWPILLFVGILFLFLITLSRFMKKQKLT